jgi:hypothetical protein
MMVLLLLRSAVASLILPDHVLDGVHSQYGFIDPYLPGGEGAKHNFVGLLWKLVFDDVFGSDDLLNTAASNLRHRILTSEGRSSARAYLSVPVLQATKYISVHPIPVTGYRGPYVCTNALFFLAPFGLPSDQRVHDILLPVPDCTNSSGVRPIKQCP